MLRAIGWVLLAAAGMLFPLAVLAAYDVTGSSAPESFQAGFWSIEATVDVDIDIDPDTLNPDSQGKFVTAYIELSGDFDVGNIDVLSVTLEVVGVDGSSVPAELSPTEVGDHDEDGIADLMVKFDRQHLIELLGGEPGDVTMTVTGMVSPPGRSFTGSDTVRVIASEGQEDAPSGDEEDSSSPPPAPSPTPLAPPVGYEVQPGDTLWAIAIRFGTTVEELVRLNRLQTPSLILYGSMLNVPYVGEDGGDAPADVSPQSRRASGRRSGQ